MPPNSQTGTSKTVLFDLEDLLRGLDKEIQNPLLKIKSYKQSQGSGGTFRVRLLQRP